MPTMTRPEVKRPDLDLAALLRGRSEAAERARSAAESAREGNLPHLELPTLEQLRRELPRVDLSRIDLGPSSRTRRAIAEQISPSPSPLPFIAGAMIVGLLVGWMLAVSPVTGPRIREMASDVRGRLGRWRAGALGEWEAAEELAGRAEQRAPTPQERWTSQADIDAGVPVGPGQPRPAQTATTPFDAADS